MPSLFMSHEILPHKKKYRITSILSKAPTRFELVIEVLQTFALPLGYGAITYMIII